MRVKHSLVVLLFLICGIIDSLSAKHISGTYLTYQHYGSNSVIVKFYIIKDCSSTTPALPDSFTYSVFNASNKKLFNKRKVWRYGYPAAGSYVPTPTDCKGFPAVCLQEGLYMDTLSLNTDSVGYHITWSANQRTTSITNLNNASTYFGNVWYAFVPKAKIKNTTPYILNSEFSVICSKTKDTIKFNIKDPDGDSVSIFADTPWSAGIGASPLNTPPPYNKCKYATGYSVKAPFGASGSFGSGSVAGHFIVIPNTAGQFVLAFQIDEYRYDSTAKKKVKIGTTRYDAIYYSVTCKPNNLPLFGNYPNKERDSFYIAADSNFCYNITATDKDTSDTLTLLLTSKIKGINLKSDTSWIKKYLPNTYITAKGNLCWQPTKNDISANPYYVDCILKDRTKCSISSRRISIFVVPYCDINSHKPNAVFKDSMNGNRQYLFYSLNNNYDKYYWDFGDGTLDSTSGDSVTHTFASDGKYDVKLLVKTKSGCNDFSVHKINVISTAYDLSGIVYLGNSKNKADYGTVYLIKYNPADSTLQAVDSTFYKPADSGKYIFKNLSAGKYLVKSFVSQQSAYDMIPTYHDSSFRWNKADSLNIFASSLINKDIYLISGSSYSGPGFIGGKVTEGANKKPGDPVGRQEVILMNSSMYPIAYTMSDTLGKFSFSNLPYGGYYISGEVPGLIPTVAYYNLSASNPKIDDVSIIVNRKTVVVYTFSNTDSKIISGVKVFPNPVMDELKLSFNADKVFDYKISITDVKGMSLKNITSKTFIGVNQQKINLSGIPSGIYFLKITTKQNEHISNIKFFKE